MNTSLYLLEKLGEALYTHAKTASIADDAFASVEYLASKGIFDTLNTDADETC
jgi:hypothetical protein